MKPQKFTANCESIRHIIQSQNKVVLASKIVSVERYSWRQRCFFDHFGNIFLQNDLRAKHRECVGSLVRKF